MAPICLSCSGGVKPGVVGPQFVASVSPRGISTNGSTINVLKEIAGGPGTSGFFIDNMTAHCLGENECLIGQIQVIDASVGLLNTPVIEQSIITFDMMFEPRLVCGQFIALSSITEPVLSGAYKVISIKHRGMISPTVCGDAVTTVGLAASTSAFAIVGAA